MAPAAHLHHLHAQATQRITPFNFVRYGDTHATHASTHRCAQARVHTQSTPPPPATEPCRGLQTSKASTRRAGAQWSTHTDTRHTGISRHSAPQARGQHTHRHPAAQLLRRVYALPSGQQHNGKHDDENGGEEERGQRRQAADTHKRTQEAHQRARCCSRFPPAHTHTEKEKEKDRDADAEGSTSARRATTPPLPCLSAPVCARVQAGRREKKKRKENNKKQEDEESRLWWRTSRCELRHALCTAIQPLGRGEAAHARAPRSPPVGSSTAVAPKHELME